MERGAVRLPYEQSKNERPPHLHSSYIFVERRYPFIALLERGKRAARAPVTKEVLFINFDSKAISISRFTKFICLIYKIKSSCFETCKVLMFFLGGKQKCYKSNV